MSAFLGFLVYDYLQPKLLAAMACLVILGPEGFERESETGVPIIQVLHDPAGDTYEQATGTRLGRYVKWTGVKVRFKGASPKPGATSDDHEAVVEPLVDAFITTLENGAHRYGLKLRNIRGAEFKPTGSDEDTSLAGYFYQLQLQIGRGLRETPPKQAPGFVPKNQIVVGPPQTTAPYAPDGADHGGYGTPGPVVNAQGTKGSIVATSPATLSFTDAGVTVTTAMLGRLCTITGCKTPANNGLFRVNGILSTTSFTVENPNAVSPDANNGSIAWTITEQELVVPGS